jgi:hypothetical protein
MNKPDTPVQQLPRTDKQWNPYESQHWPSLEVPAFKDGLAHARSTQTAPAPEQRQGANQSVLIQGVAVCLLMALAKLDKSGDRSCARSSILSQVLNQTVPISGCALL